jgi:hypothetical protein
MDVLSQAYPLLTSAAGFAMQTISVADDTQACSPEHGRVVVTSGQLKGCGAGTAGVIDSDHPFTESFSHI